MRNRVWIEPIKERWIIGYSPTRRPTRSFCNQTLPSLAPSFDVCRPPTIQHIQSRYLIQLPHRCHILKDITIITIDNLILWIIKESLSGSVRLASLYSGCPDQKLPSFHIDEFDESKACLIWTKSNISQQ